MPSKAVFILGLAAGYVLGARAGRKRYDQIASAAGNVWNSGPVQKQVDAVEDFVKDKAPVVAGMLADGVKTVAGAASGASKSSTKSSSAKRTPAKRTSTSGSTSAASKAADSSTDS